MIIYIFKMQIISASSLETLLLQQQIIILFVGITQFECKVRMLRLDLPPKSQVYSMNMFDRRKAMCPKQDHHGWHDLEVFLIDKLFIKN